MHLPTAAQCSSVKPKFSNQSGGVALLRDGHKPWPSSEASSVHNKDILEVTCLNPLPCLACLSDQSLQCGISSLLFFLSPDASCLEFTDLAGSPAAVHFSLQCLLDTGCDSNKGMHPRTESQPSSFSHSSKQSQKDQSLPRRDLSVCLSQGHLTLVQHLLPLSPSGVIIGWTQA